MPTPKPNTAERLRSIDTDSAAALLGVTRRHLEKLRQEGGGPPFVKVGRRCIRYRVRDIERWQDARLANSTAERGAAP
jgi:predicted DNA-binding transcriptional regulator AlpA